MSEGKQADEKSVAEEASSELSQEQLDKVAGGIIVVDGRLADPPEPERLASTTFDDPLLGGPDTILKSTSS